jgi:cysteine-S-conjugate beta-lyase
MARWADDCTDRLSPRLARAGHLHPTIRRRKCAAPPRRSPHRFLCLSRSTCSISVATTSTDRLIDRTGTSSTKWDKVRRPRRAAVLGRRHGLRHAGVHPPAVLARLEHPVIGYTRTPATLVEAFQGWLLRHYGWEVPESWLVWLPGVVTGFNLAARAVASPAAPFSFPRRSTTRSWTCRATPARRHSRAAGARRRALGHGFRRPGTARCAPTPGCCCCRTPEPHRARLRRAELERWPSSACATIWCCAPTRSTAACCWTTDAEHVPVASLSPEIAARTISLYAATKTYNIPGLSCGVAVIPDPICGAFKRAQAGPGPQRRAAGVRRHRGGVRRHAALAAAPARLPARQSQRLQAVAGERMTPVEATYLAWIDVRDLGLESPGAYFEAHGLGLSDGAAFGGEGFVRFNFACPRACWSRGAGAGGSRTPRPAAERR